MDDAPVGNDPAPREAVDAGRTRDAELVDEARAGDQRAFGRLYDAWFDRVYNLSLRIVRSPEVAAEVAQDTFLSAWKNLGTLENTEAFGGWLLRIARNASFNRHTREQRSSPVDEAGFAVIESTAASPSSAPAGFGVEERLGRLADPQSLAEDGELVTLVRDTAAALGERDAEVLDLQLRYGLTPAEIGEVMGMNRNAANQLVHRVKGRFATALRARVLWKGERPACAVLDGLLRSAGVQRFDSEAVRIADAHANGCARCDERRELRLQPSALFAAVPILMAPALFKQQAAGALELAGVPMSGSQFATTSPTAIETTTGPGPGADRSTTGPTGSTRSHRGVRVVSMAAVMAAVLVAVVAVLASGLHEEAVDELVTAASVTTVASSAPDFTTSGAAAVGTTAAVTDTGVSEPPVTEPPVGDQAPSAGPVTPTQPPSDPAPAAVSSVGFGIPAPQLQARVKAGYAFDGTGPKLTWAVVGQGAFTVSVAGPGSESGGGLPSSQASGSAPVCPGSIDVNPNSGQLQCNAKAGSYVYTLTVRDGTGNVLLQRQATLFIL